MAVWWNTEGIQVHSRASEDMTKIKAGRIVLHGGWVVALKHRRYFRWRAMYVEHAPNIRITPMYKHVPESVVPPQRWAPPLRHVCRSTKLSRVFWIYRSAERRWHRAAGAWTGVTCEEVAAEGGLGHATPTAEPPASSSSSQSSSSQGPGRTLGSAVWWNRLPILCVDSVLPLETT